MTRIVACAVVRDDPPIVFMADDIETLNWVLATRVVATIDGRDLESGVREILRAALREERWGDAVAAYIDWTDTPIDVYESSEVLAPNDVAMAPLELQFLPLFAD
jgi:plasmid stability protein